MALDLGPDSAIPLGVDAIRYSFIVMDLHHLLLAGLPAHSGLPPTPDILSARRHVSEGAASLPQERGAGTEGWNAATLDERHTRELTSNLSDHGSAAGKNVER